MYKELSDILKNYSPSENEVHSIESGFLSTKFVHSGGNLYGEQYEAWVFEYLKNWALSSVDVSFFVEKFRPPKSSLEDGLNYDKNGQIIFLKSGKRIAEYDGIFCFKNKIIFVESSVSELRSYYRNLEDRLIKKRELLMDFLGTEEVYYLVVTRPKKKSLVYRSLPNLILYKLKDPDFEQITPRVSEVCNSIKADNNKLIDIRSISSFYLSSS